MLEFFIRDTGEGIQKDNLEIIFDRFMQEDISSTRIFGGTGLGLTISKAIINILGGKISVKSEPGEGTVFYFTIPYNRARTVVKETPKISSTKTWMSKTILVAEDVDDSYYVIENMLKETGATIVRAIDGSEAVDLCKKVQKIDLILMDMRMPRMNGYEATIEIKKLNPEIPIIAQTAFAIRGDKDKALKAGCDDYLTKPINPKILIARINFWLSKNNN